MSASERRGSIINVLLVRKHDTISNLANEYNVSLRTLRRDIESLSLSYPIYTVPGVGGGVFVLDGIDLNDKSFTKVYLLIKGLLKTLSSSDKDRMKLKIDNLYVDELH